MLSRKQATENPYINQSQPLDYELVFTAAGSIPLPVSGHYITILAATSDVFITVDNITELQRGKKDVINTSGFNRLNIRSAVAQTVRLCISDTPQQLGRDDVAVSVSATIGPAATWDALADASNTVAGVKQIATADATVLSYVFTNPSSNTGTIRVLGDNTVSASKGAIVEPGQSIVRAYPGDVYAYFPVIGEALAIERLRS